MKSSQTRVHFSTLSNNFIRWIKGLSAYTKNKTINAFTFFLAVFIIGGTNFFLMFHRFIPTFFILDFLLIILFVTPIFFFKKTMFDRIYLPILLFLITALYALNAVFFAYFGTVFSIKDIPWALQNIKQVAIHSKTVKWWIVWMDVGLYLTFALFIIFYNIFLRFNDNCKQIKPTKKKQLIFAFSLLFGSLGIYELSLQMWSLGQRSKGINDIDYVNFSPNYHFSQMGMINYYNQEIRQIAFDRGNDVNEIRSWMSESKYLNDDFTGMLSNSNVIVILVETGDQIMLNPYTTPNLWSLLNNGIYCNQNYSYNRTNQSDVMSITGSYTSFNLDTSYSLTLPFDIPNILKDKYNTYFTTDLAKINDGYDTMNFIKKFGYKNYFFHDDLIPEEEPWLYEYNNFTRDSIFMNALINKIKSFPTDHPFYLQYLTIHMHLQHVLTDKNKAMYESLEKDFGKKLDEASPEEWQNPFDPDSEDGKCFRKYTLTTMDFDMGLGNLMQALYQSDSVFLKNTLLIPFGDHYWYEVASNEQTYAQIIKQITDMQNIKQYSTIMGLYHPKLNAEFAKTHPDHKLNKTTWPTVIVPTVLDLLGEKYNPRMYMNKSIFDSEFNNNEVYYSFWSNAYLNENFCSTNGHDITQTYNPNANKEEFLNKLNFATKQRRYLDTIYKNNIFATYNYESFMPKNITLPTNIAFVKEY